eukprot:Tbor_TRINITY_DN10210_c0_g1::TRINITY_DN10210_c0_g1_i1::g.5393::m.5393
MFRGAPMTSSYANSDYGYSTCRPINNVASTQLTSQYRHLANLESRHVNRSSPTYNRRINTYTRMNDENRQRSRTKERTLQSRPPFNTSMRTPSVPMIQRDRYRDHIPAQHWKRSEIPSSEIPTYHRRTSPQNRYDTPRSVISSRSNGNNTVKEMLDNIIQLASQIADSTAIPGDDIGPYTTPQAQEGSPQGTPSVLKAKEIERIVKRVEQHFNAKSEKLANENINLRNRIEQIEAANNNTLLMEEKRARLQVEEQSQKLAAEHERVVNTLEERVKRQDQHIRELLVSLHSQNVGNGSPLMKSEIEPPSDAGTPLRSSSNKTVRKETNVSSESLDWLGLSHPSVSPHPNNVGNKNRKFENGHKTEVVEVEMSLNRPKSESSHHNVLESPDPLRIGHPVGALHRMTPRSKYKAKALEATAERHISTHSSSLSGGTITPKICNVDMGLLSHNGEVTRVSIENEDIDTFLEGINKELDELDEF